MSLDVQQTKIASMKKIYQKLIMKLFKKVINKTVTEEIPDVVPVTLPCDDSKKAIWKFAIQTLINILAAVLTALGASSCVSMM